VHTANLILYKQYKTTDLDDIDIVHRLVTLLMSRSPKFFVQILINPKKIIQHFLMINRLLIFAALYLIVLFSALLSCATERLSGLLKLCSTGYSSLLSLRLA